jgi:hypothetical protein
MGGDRQVSRCAAQDGVRFADRIVAAIEEVLKAAPPE